MDSLIQYLKRNEIDSVKWDRCIDKALNGLIYGYSWWLDHLTEKWDALILNDYETVMPLTWNRKYGISYLYQPPFTQQLGVFSPQPVSSKLIELFLQEADKHFKYAEIFLNYGNPVPALTSRTNLILSLSSSYELIREGYKKDLKNNLRRAAAYHLHYVKDDNLPRALELYRQTYRLRFPHLKEKDYHRFGQACKTAREHNAVLIRAVYNEGKELLAIALILKSHGRLFLIQSTTLPEGRVAEANHFLLDNLIREFSGQPLLLDFEGSEVAGISHFYKNFGSTIQPYFFYKKNALPWPLYLLKK